MFLSTRAQTDYELVFTPLRLALVVTGTFVTGLVIGGATAFLIIAAALA